MGSLEGYRHGVLEGPRHQSWNRNLTLVDLWDFLVNPRVGAFRSKLTGPCTWT